MSLKFPSSIRINSRPHTSAINSSIMSNIAVCSTQFSCISFTKRSMSACQKNIYVHGHHFRLFFWRDWLKHHRFNRSGPFIIVYKMKCNHHTSLLRMWAKHYSWYNETACVHYRMCVYFWHTGTKQKRENFF